MIIIVCLSIVDDNKKPLLMNEDLDFLRGVMHSALMLQPQFSKPEQVLKNSNFGKSYAICIKIIAESEGIETGRDRGRKHRWEKKRNSN